MYRLNKVNFNKVFKINGISYRYTMEIQDLIRNHDYIQEFKKHKVVYRNYPELNLMIVKRKYGTTYCPDNPWLNSCRGLVIDTKLNDIVVYPPVKAIEIQTYDQFKGIALGYQELIDGTMVNMFYHNESNKWLISTRSNIGCSNQWSTDMSFKDMFDDCSKNLDYETLNKSNTYSFVMRHKKNRIITPVFNNELYLVEVRCRGELMDIPRSDGWKCLQTIEPPSLSKNQTDMYKGYTVMINGVRYKWLTAECKFIEMIKPNTNNPLLNYLTLRHSGHLTNYLKLFPEERFRFDKYRKQVHQLTGILHQFYLNVFVHKQIDKKDIPFALNPLMYDLHGIYLKEKQGISWSRVKNYIYELEPKRLCFALNNL